MTDDRFRDWDAAYVLGSLSSAERHEYEQHLAACATCSRALADLVGMPALLATVSQAEAFSLLAEAAPDAAADPGVDARPAPTGPAPTGPAPGAPVAPSLLPSLAHRVRRTRMRRRTVAAGAAALAIAAAVALTLAVSLPAPPATQEQAGSAGTELAFTAEVVSPLEAEAKLADEPWGTRIDWTCSYRGQAGSEGARGYSMLVTDREGKDTQVASWTSGPGTTATPTATTSIRRADIAAVSIVSTASGTVLLRSVLAPAE